MPQRWYHKASNQTAIITTVGVLIVALIQVLWVESIRSENDQLRKENKAKGDEVQRLETMLVPFKTIALERYTGTEAEALAKLAERIVSIEKQMGELDRLREIAAKHEFKPVGTELRRKLIELFTEQKTALEKEGISIQVTYETWVPKTTRQFAEELVKIFKEAGLKVSGPSFATVFLIGPAYSFELGYNKDEETTALGFLASVQQVIRPGERYIRRDSLQKGMLRLHFAGQVVFGPSGEVQVQ